MVFGGIFVGRGGEANTAKMYMEFWQTLNLCNSTQIDRLLKFTIISVCAHISEHHLQDMHIIEFYAIANAMTSVN